MGRRAAMAGAGACTVWMFDPVRRSWITAAHAHSNDCAVSIPRLDGELVVDPTALAEAADDFGHIVHRTPIAVLRPGSAKDIQRIVRYAGRHGLEVAMRGQGHARFGQAQVEEGVVIDSRTLARVDAVVDGSVWAEAGATWSQVVTSTLPSGLTVPVVNNYMHLSVGGTLSVGGFGGATHLHGMQVDNVLELEVVTGDGRSRRCSPSFRSDLFEAALGGMGQCALIVRARLQLHPAPAMAHAVQLTYLDLPAFMADQRMLLAEGRFDELAGQAVLTPQGWRFILEGVVFFDPPHAPSDEALLGDLGHAAESVVDAEYLAWAHRADPIVQQQIDLGLWALPHPWIDVFVPDEEADDFIAQALATLSSADTGGGPVPIFPFPVRTSLPFVKLPDADVAFVFGIFRLAQTPEIAESMVSANRALYEAALAVGSTMYPIDAIPMSSEDWVTHYGDTWSTFVQRKATYDPHHVLTPGPGIFA